MDELSNELSMLGRLMDASALRTRVIAHNLANVNTPNFTRSKVVFEEALGEAMRRGVRSSAEKIRPKVEIDTGGEVKADGNNVHMEVEMAEMVKNAILYNIVNRIVDGKVKGLRLAIEGH